jgi:hypothetical protein
MKPSMALLALTIACSSSSPSNSATSSCGALASCCTGATVSSTVQVCEVVLGEDVEETCASELVELSQAGACVAGTGTGSGGTSTSEGSSSVASSTASGTSSSSGSGAGGWGCAAGASTCLCYNPPASGYDLAQCGGGYSCCWQAEYSMGGAPEQECECINASPCTQSNPSATRVNSCP